MQRNCLLALGLALFVAGCGDNSGPTDTNTPPDLASSTTNGSISINVLLKQRATAAHRSELAKYGTLSKKELPDQNVLFMRIKASELATIQKLPFVAAAGPDAERTARPIDLVPNADLSSGGNAWGLDAINVTDFNATNVSGPAPRIGFSGQGVCVAVLDSGLLPTWRQYLPNERVLTQYAKAFGGGGGPNGTDLYDENVSEQPNKWEQDTDTHGTHVTSIITGFLHTSGIKNGVAPLANIIVVKVLNQNGSGQSSTVARGIVYVTDLFKERTTNGLAAHCDAMVINMSLGGSLLDPIEGVSLDYAVANGVVVVASAGNSGPDGAMGFPGAYKKVISVAAAGWIQEWNDCGPLATDFQGTWWRACDVPEAYDEKDFYIVDFSAKQTGDQDLDVAAPGSWVVGPWQVNQSNRMSWFFVGGTSQASPHVAGLVALMLDKNAGFVSAFDATAGVTQAEKTLEATARALTHQGQQVREGPGGLAPLAPSSILSWDATRSGAGLVDAFAALNAVP